MNNLGKLMGTDAKPAQTPSLPHLLMHTQKCNVLSKWLRESRFLALSGLKREFHATSERNIPFRVLRCVYF